MTIKKRLLLILFAFNSWIILSAQMVSKNDSIYINERIDKALTLHYSNEDSAYILIDEAIAKAKTFSSPSALLAHALMIKGDIIKSHDDYDTPLALYQQSWELYRELKNSRKMVSLYNRLGVTYFAKGSTQLALDYYHKGLKIAEEKNDTLFLSAIRLNMGSCYIKMGAYSKALTAYVETTHLFKAIKDTINYGMGYQYITQLYNITGDYPKAVENILESERIIKTQKNNPNYLYNLAYVYLTKGETYSELPDSVEVLGQIANDMVRIGAALNLPTIEGSGFSYKSAYFDRKERYDSALVYAKKSYSIVKNNAFTNVQAGSAKELGIVHFKIGNLEEAEQYLQESLSLEQQDAANIQALDDIYNYLSQVYEKKGDFQRAYDYLLKRQITQDSLFAKEKEKLVEEVEATYKTKEQAAEIKLQENQIARQRLFNIAVGIVAILLLGFGIFAYRTAQQRKKNNALLAAQSQQLQSLDKAKSRFFANISHELRTPLTLIIAPLENAIKRVKNKLVKTDLELAKDNSKKLLTLVNEILDLTKLESGQMQLNKQAVRLEELIRRILFSYHSLANLRGFMLSFQFYLEKELVVQIDIEKLEKVINNLLSNAFKYSQPGGVITLTVNPIETTQFSIEVEDHGVGIAPEALEQIFDRFYQVEGEEQPLQGGTGIGLSLAKELVEAMDGTLTVESEVDKGTTFRATLPLEKATNHQKVIEMMPLSTTTKEETTYVPLSLDGKTAKILIVEDNPEMSKFLHHILSPHYQCTVATDGNKALKILETQTFDLITSDVMMPNRDGFSLLETVRKMPNNSHLPFVLLTARSLEEDKLKGLRLGVDDYITKPFSTDELIARIHNLLTNKFKRATLSAEPEPENDNTLPAIQALLSKAEQFVVQNLDNPKYRVDDFAKDLAYSRRQLARIIQKETGFTLVEFIREIRLQKAYRMLEQQQFLTIAEVRYAVGFENGSYFTKVFTERFGVKPSEVMR